MDPATIIGTTSAVLTFVDTAVKIFSTARQVHDSATGGLEEHERLRDITSTLEHGIATLEQKRDSKTTLSDEETSMLKTQPEVKELKQELNMCTIQLNAHLTLISRSDILEKLDNLFAGCRKEHSIDFKEIRDTLETTLVDVSEKSNGLIKQIDSMELKLDRAVDNDSVWLERIKKLQELFEASDSTIKEINCYRILKAIAFKDIKVRHKQVAYVELAENTFEWMVKDEAVPSSQKRLQQSFRNWLEHGEGIFHISGKPGSGKSTLMNFLVDHPGTRSQLNKWACNGNTVIIASVFLWNIGSVEQKGMDGVLRTLLHNILNNHKEFIPQLFGNIWNPSGREPWVPQQHLELTRKEMKDALQKLLSDTTRGYQYCLFIDGADEFEDENMPRQQFAAELIRWASHQGVKICVSSREEAPWTSRFFNYPKLELHLTTQQDIRKMIEKYLSDDLHLKTFDPTESRKFVNTFVDMASGVFIWVKLVLRELEAKLDYEASLEALYQALNDVPEKLDEFYERILLKIPPSDTREAWTILDILVEVAESIPFYGFNIYHYSLIGDLIANSDFYQQTSDYIPLSDDMASEADDRMAKFRKRLPLLFRGMVEVVLHPDYEGISVRETLAFSHRSMYEYLRTRPSQDKNRPQVDKEMMMLKCLIGQANCFWNHNHSTQAGMLSALMYLLPRIQDTFKDLILPVLGFLDETLLRRQLKEHEDPFLNFYITPDQPDRTTLPNMQVVSVFSWSCELGFHEYLDWAMHNCPLWRENEVFRAAAVASVWRGFRDKPVRPAETLHILFADEFGPNSWYMHHLWPCSMTPWIRFLFFFIQADFDPFRYPLWSIVTAFLKHRADVSLVFSWTIRDKKPMRYIGNKRSPSYYALKDVQVEIGARQDSQSSENNTLSFGGKHLAASEEVGSRFPHGGSVREILLHFGPKNLSTFFDTSDKDCEPTEVGSRSQSQELFRKEKRKRIRLCDLLVQSILMCEFD
ncbi:hypothetical protein FDECE_11177 [Fusarium decemcellulare]|nr:hypothetical protein FDECE_11177 [Fusarium decemcellulare]